MQPLKALHQKFDIANAARSQFDVQAGLHAAPGRKFFADPLAGLGNRLHRSKIERAPVD